MPLRRAARHEEEYMKKILSLLNTEGMRYLIIGGCTTQVLVVIGNYFISRFIVFRDRK